MQRFEDVVTDKFGNVVQGAEITILDADGNVATLYSDRHGLGQPLPNPLTTDENGVFWFYAPNGRYTAREGATGRELADVILWDPADLLTTADFLGDWVVSGLLPTVPNPASLTMATPSGVAVVGGTRVSKGASVKTYTAERDTYVDLARTGDFVFSEVPNGGLEPPIASGTIRLFKVVTDATAITTVVDLRRQHAVLVPEALVRAPGYTIAELPPAADHPRGIVYVEDDAGGPVLAFSDGANWRRVTDRNVVST